MFGGIDFHLREICNIALHEIITPCPRHDLGNNPALLLMPDEYSVLN